MKKIISIVITFICLLPGVSWSEDCRDPGSLEYHPAPEIKSVKTEDVIEGRWTFMHSYLYPDPYGHCATDQEFADHLAASPRNSGRQEGSCKKCSTLSLRSFPYDGTTYCVEDNCEYGYLLRSYKGAVGCVKCPPKYDFISGVCKWNSWYGTAPQRKLSLRVYRKGTGSGKVAGSGIDCGTSSCRKSYSCGDKVTLRATPDKGSFLNNYVYDENGVNSCSGNKCTIKMTADQQVVFIFQRKTRAIYTGRIGSGKGEVVSVDNSDIRCGGDCWERYPVKIDPQTKKEIDVFITLLAKAAPGSYFDGWEGTNCSKQDPISPTCRMKVTGVHSVYATFKQPTLYTYVKSWNQNGSGTIIGKRINCGDRCSAQYDKYPATVSLTARPDPGSEFVGWYGDCSGTGPCRVFLKKDRYVGARFNRVGVTAQLPNVLVIEPNGNGSGTVIGSVTGGPRWMVCRKEVKNPLNGCIGYFRDWTRVTLSARPDPDSRFTGWSTAGPSTNGFCPGTGDCSITMISSAIVFPRFVRNSSLRLPPPPGRNAGPSNNSAGPFLLYTPQLGFGSGQVTSLPGGITCGADCTGMYRRGTSVTLSADPAPGSAFSGWLGGGCSGVGGCTVTMNNDLSVGAAFSRNSISPVLKALLLAGSKMAPGLKCGEGKVYDCAEKCVNKATALDYIGDTFCDDGKFGYDLRCGAFNNDSGDCDNGNVIILQ